MGAIRLQTDEGILSKGACLCVEETENTDTNLNGLYKLLIPTTTLPTTYSAPATVEKTVLTDSKVTQVEGLQTVEQKQYTFNYHRDNIKVLKKYAGKKINFLERNADNTGERYSGTLAFGRNDVAVNGIEQGTIYVTVNKADEYPIDDVRDMVIKTAIVDQLLEDINITGTGSVIVPLTLSENATLTATSGSTSIATATWDSTKSQLTVTGVASGNTFITLVVSATGEASSTRTIAVTVE